MAEDGSNSRNDFVDEEVIKTFVGNVEPGGEVSTTVVVWSVLFSIALAVGTTLWWCWH